MARSGVGVADRIREMMRIVGVFEGAGFAVDELRSLLVGALACAEAGEDWRRDGARVIELCEALAASIPLEGAELREAVVRVFGGE